MGAAGRIARGGFYYYLATITNNATGLAYILVITMMLGGTAVGYMGTSIAFSMLVIGVVSLGVTRGAQGIISRAYGSGDPRGLGVAVGSLIAYMVAAHCAASAALYTLYLLGVSVWRISGELLAYSALLVLSGSGMASMAVFLGLHEADKYFYTVLAGNIAKMTVGVVLAAYFMGWPGAVIGYSASYFVQLASIPLVLHRHGIRPRPTLAGIREVVGSGVPSWLPDMLVLAGQMLGVIIVYGVEEAGGAGLFYIASTAANAVLMMPLSVAGILYPVLSAGEEEPEMVTGKTVSYIVALAAPPTVAVAVYSRQLLGLIRPEYAAASGVLQVLLASMPFMAYAGAVSSYYYSRGMYRTVLSIGLSQSLPRILAYYPLVLLHGPLGAAEAYLAGAVAGSLIARVYAGRVGIALSRRPLAAALLVNTASLILGYAASLLHWFLGFAATLLLPYAAYPGLRVLPRGLAVEAARAIAGDAAAALIERIIDVLGG